MLQYMYHIGGNHFLNLQQKKAPLIILEEMYLSENGSRYILLLLLRSNPSRQHSEVLYRWGGGKEKREDRKTRKSRSKEKIVGFSPSSLLPGRKLEAVTHGGNYRDRPTDLEDNPGSRCRKARPRAHSRYIHVKQEKQLNPHSPQP